MRWGTRRPRDPHRSGDCRGSSIRRSHRSSHWPASRSPSTTTWLLLGSRYTMGQPRSRHPARYFSRRAMMARDRFAFLPPFAGKSSLKPAAGWFPAGSASLPESAWARTELSTLVSLAPELRRGVVGVTAVHTWFFWRWRWAGLALGWRVSVKPGPHFVHPLPNCSAAPWLWIA